jgi:hypothetical protein
MRFVGVMLFKGEDSAKVTPLYLRYSHALYHRLYPSRLPPPPPIPFDNLSLNRARILDGKHVLVSLLVAKPPYPWKGSTIVDVDDGDGIERTAVLVGKRLDLEVKRIVVAGTLRAIEHPVRLVG